eukprot:5102068-Pleurochrysis_carterae.AAC.2
MQDRSDERVNDGNNYRGLMNVADYSKKRKEVSMAPEERRAKLEDVVREKLNAEKRQVQKEELERQERARLKKERLQKELKASEDTEQEAHAPADSKKKKRRKTPSSSFLSFDTEDA